MKSPFGDAGDAQFMVKNPLEDADPASSRRLLASRSEFSDLSRLSDAQVRAQVAALSSTGRLPAARARAPENARPTVQSTPEEKAAAAAVTPVVKQPSLRILSLDDHFAPRAERITINYRVDEVSAKKVVLQVSSDHYPNNPIYEKELTGAEKSNGVHSLQWDGKTTCSAGPLKDLYLNPLYAPYKVTLKADGLQDKAEFKVFYHSVTLASGSYTADGKAPPESDNLKWMQYKLNELGYFAGPIDGAKNGQTKRALKRYSYEIPGLAESDDENNIVLKNHLAANRFRRSIFENRGVIDRNMDSKLFLDHDYFYHGVTDFSNWISPQGHGTKDAEKLDRFEFPIEARVLLVSRSDADGTKAGIDAPEAVGPVEIEWMLRDPLEDTMFLPVPTADIPSHGKAYIDKMLQSTAGNAGDAKDAKDNAPASNNGVRGTVADHFIVGAVIPPFSSRSAGARVFSTAHADNGKDANKLGRSGILFRGSYIAGDSWALKARIAFENEANKGELKTLHETFRGKTFDDILLAETGVMTLWRRRHVSCVIDWPSPAASIDWKGVTHTYKLAQNELDSKHTKLSIEQFLPTDIDKDEYLDLVATHTGVAKKKLKFDPQGMYALDLPSQGITEDADTYRKRINKLVDAFLKSDNYKFLIALGNWIRKRVKKAYGPGIVVVRTNFCRPVKVRTPLPLIGIINPFSYETFVPSILCIGLPEGVTVISNPMHEKEQDGFLIAHEAGHCYYLSHHEIDGQGAAQVPKDHDTDDKNCTMSYPFGIKSRAGLTWHRGDLTEPRFCGKCILKLRGWKVADGGLPDKH